MERFKIIVLLLFFYISSLAQVKTDTIKKEIVHFEIDSTSSDTIKLPELFVYRDNMSAQEKKDFLLLQSRVYKVYPFAKYIGIEITSPAINKIQFSIFRRAINHIPTKNSPVTNVSIYDVQWSNLWKKR